MSIPQIKMCCYGFSLQAGTKMIGWLHLALSITALIVLSQSLEAGRYILTETPAGVIVLENTAYDYLVALCVGSIVATAVSILLIAGAYNRQPGKLLVWVIYTAIASAVFFVGIVYGSGMMLSEGMTGAAVGNLFGGLLILAIQVYFLIVAYSFYRDLKVEHGVPKINF